MSTLNPEPYLSTVFDCRLAGRELSSLHFAIQHGHLASDIGMVAAWFPSNPLIEGVPFSEYSASTGRLQNKKGKRLTTGVPCAAKALRISDYDMGAS